MLVFVFLFFVFSFVFFCFLLFCFCCILFCIFLYSLFYAMFSFLLFFIFWLEHYFESCMKSCSCIDYWWENFDGHWVLFLLDVGRSNFFRIIWPLTHVQNILLLWVYSLVSALCCGVYSIVGMCILEHTIWWIRALFFIFNHGHCLI